MIREGVQDVTLKFLSHNPQNKLAINNFTEGESSAPLQLLRACANASCTRGSMDYALTKYGLPVQTQGRNIRAYADYLVQRAKAYARTKVDYVRAGDGRLKKMNVDKGLLRETEEVQEQIWALLRCDVCQSKSSAGLIDTTNSRFAGKSLKRAKIGREEMASKPSSEWTIILTLNSFSTRNRKTKSLLPRSDYSQLT